MPKLLLRNANDCTVLHLLLLSKYFNSLPLCGYLDPLFLWTFKSTPEQLLVTDFYVMCHVVITPVLLNYLF